MGSSGISQSKYRVKTYEKKVKNQVSDEVPQIDFRNFLNISNEVQEAVKKEETRKTLKMKKYGFNKFQKYWFKHKLDQ